LLLLQLLLDQRGWQRHLLRLWWWWTWCSQLQQLLMLQVSQPGG
jgi:hypothetical protein